MRLDDLKKMIDEQYTLVEKHAKRKNTKRKRTVILTLLIFILLLLAIICYQDVLLDRSIQFPTVNTGDCKLYSVSNHGLSNSLTNLHMSQYFDL